MAGRKLLPLSRDGLLRPEYVEWCQVYRRARVRAMLRNYQHLGKKDIPLLEQLAFLDFVAERLADAIYSGDREYTTPDDTGIEDGTGSKTNTHRQPLAMYTHYVKTAQGLRNTLLMTPASRRNAILEEDKQDAIALMAETRRAIIAKAKEREKLKAITVEAVPVGQTQPS